MAIGLAPSWFGIATEIMKPIPSTTIRNRAVATNSVATVPRNGTSNQPMPTSHAERRVDEADHEVRA